MNHLHIFYFFLNNLDAAVKYKFIGNIESCPHQGVYNLDKKRKSNKDEEVWS